MVSRIISSWPIGPGRDAFCETLGARYDYPPRAPESAPAGGGKVAETRRRPSPQGRNVQGFVPCTRQAPRFRVGLRFATDQAGEDFDVLLQLGVGLEQLSDPITCVH